METVFFEKPVHYSQALNTVGLGTRAFMDFSFDTDRLQGKLNHALEQLQSFGGEFYENSTLVINIVQLRGWPNKKNQEPGFIILVPGNCPRIEKLIASSKER